MLLGERLSCGVIANNANMVKKIEEIIKKVVGEGVNFLVMTSERSEFGNYSTNVAFMIPGNPNELAEKIKDAGGDLFEKVEVKGRFINFWISKNALIEELTGFLQNPKSYILNSKSLKINLEFVSANPTGPLTMANGRGGFLGDVIANVLENIGVKVTREYYINDAGNQIKLLGESVLLSHRKALLGEEHYKGEYVEELAGKLKSKIEKLKTENAEEIGRMAAEELMRQIKKSVQDVGIKFDVWFSEYQKLRKGKEIQKVLDLLERKKLVERKEGATWLKTSDIADEKDRVLVKSDGQPTYFLVDLAYHYDKLVKRKFNKAIDIWGADHHGYVARLKSGIKALGLDPERLKIIIIQLVRLVENGQEVKMSKRAGEFVTLDELIKEVGKDAARFFFLSYSPDTHMDFDLDLAKEKSSKNPVYYVQYAYVRCNSILQKAKSKIFNFQFSIFNKFSISKFKNLNTESEMTLVRELMKLPDIILQTAEDYQVSRLARYAMELARAFHNFYEKERVIPADAEAMAGEGRKIMESRLALVAATREILGRVFDLLGIDKPKKM